jgi:hypothetical protein
MVIGPLTKEDTFMKELKNRAINIISMLRISREKIGNKSANWIAVLTQAMFYMNKVDPELQDAVHSPADPPLEPLRLNIQDFETCSQDRPVWTYDKSEEESNEPIARRTPFISSVPPKKRQSADVVKETNTKTLTQIEPLRLSILDLEACSQDNLVRSGHALEQDLRQVDTTLLTPSSSLFSLQLTSTENTKDPKQPANDQLQSTQNTLSQIDEIIDSPGTAEFTKQVYQTQSLDIREFFHAARSDNVKPHTSDDEVVPYHPSPTSELFAERKFTPFLYREFTVLQAFNADIVTKETINDIEFRLCHPRLICERCDADSPSKSITIAEEGYYQQFESQGKWFTCDMVLTFGRLCSHDVHREDIIYVDAMMANHEVDERNTKTIPINDKVHTIVSVVYVDSHFAIMKLCLETKRAYFYDGLSMPILKWKCPMVSVLRRYGISDKDWRTSAGKGNDGMDGITIKQKDQSNCGPIACMVLWKLFCDDKVNLKKIPVSTFRKHALEELQRLIAKHQDNCMVFRRKRKRFGYESSTEECNVSEGGPEEPNTGTSGLRMISKPESNINQKGMGKTLPIDKKKTQTQKTPTTAKKKDGKITEAERPSSKTSRHKAKAESDSDEYEFTSSWDEKRDPFVTPIAKKRRSGSLSHQITIPKTNKKPRIQSRNNNIKCRCKTKCGKACSCRKKGQHCHIKCSCQGKCSNC